MLSSAAVEELEALKKSLDGRSRTPDAVVTRDVLVSAVRQHQSGIEWLRGATMAIVSNYGALQASQATVQATVKGMKDKVGDSNVKFTTVVDDMRTVNDKVALFEKKVALIDGLATWQTQQESRFEAFHKLDETRREEMARLEARVSECERQLADQRRGLFAVQDRISRLGTELYIGSDQVTISAAELGEVLGVQQQLEEAAKETFTLTRALHRLGQTAGDQARGLELQRRTAVEHAEELEQKAAVGVEAAVDRNTTKIGTIEAFMEAHMDVDLMDIRRKQDEFTRMLDSHAKDLVHKTSPDQVDHMISSAYEKLVTNLQIALRSVKDDEVNFKQCIEKIEAATRDLESTKVNRKELSDLKNQLNVRLTAKGSLSPEDREKISGMIPKDVLLLMLDEKASKDDLANLGGGGPRIRRGSSSTTLAAAASARAGGGAPTTLLAYQLQGHVDQLRALQTESRNGDLGLSNRIDALASLVARLRPPTKSFRMPSSSHFAPPAIDDDLHLLAPAPAPGAAEPVRAVVVTTTVEGGTQTASLTPRPEQQHHPAPPGPCCLVCGDPGTRPAGQQGGCVCDKCSFSTKPTDLASYPSTVDATLAAPLDLPPSLIGFVGPVAPPNLRRTASSSSHGSHQQPPPISRKATHRKPAHQPAATKKGGLQCLSCDAALHPPHAEHHGPHPPGRTLGAGFKTGAIVAVARERRDVEEWARKVVTEVDDMRETGEAERLRQENLMAEAHATAANKKTVNKTTASAFDKKKKKKASGGGGGDEEENLPSHSA